MPETFATLLRGHRLRAALTQEGLAERAGISAAGVAALEAGRRRAPRLSTVALLVDALDLDPSARAALVAAAAPPEADRPAPRSMTPPAAPAAALPSLAPADLRARLAVHRRYPFVGRPDELARLWAAWRRRTRVLLVVGEAGVGKTRLAGELASAIHDDGVTVLWGRSTSERLGAFETFVEPIRTVVRSRSDTALVGQGELVRLVPELALATHGAVVPSKADAGVERRLLFEAVASLLATLGPLLLVLDDLQWADAASLGLLAFLAGAPQLHDLVLLGTVRSTDLTAPTAAALAELRRAGTVERVELSGLGHDDVGRLVELVAGCRPFPGLVDAVVHATDGNPFFVEELTEHLVQLGASEPLGAGVPEGVRATLGHRIAGLSLDAQALLRAGAVLGRQFDAPLAGRLADLDGPRLLAATEDALLSALVTEPSARTLSFSHALVRTAVYEAISASRRVELHRQAALQLEQAGPTTSGEIADLVRHWAAVASVDRAAAASAASWAVRAGDAASASAATDQAIACYQQAITLWSGSTAEHADALIRLGMALSASGRQLEADERFRSALQLAEAIDDAVLLARAALGLSATLRYGHSDPSRIAALELAIERLGPAEGVLRPAALAMLMRQLGFDPSAAAYARRQEAAALVLEAVSKPDPPERLLLALGAARDSIPVDEPVALGRLTRQIIAAATARRELPILANVWYGQAWSTLELGDAAGWRAAIAGYTAVADELQLPYELSLAAAMAATDALIRGRYADAERRSQEALAHAAVTGDENASAVHLTNAVLRGIDLGQAPEMLELMRAVRADYVNVPTFLAGLTLTAAAAGDVAFAGSLLDDQAAAGFDSIRHDAEWLPVVGFLASACAMAGVNRHAEALHALLATSPATTVRVGPLAGWWGPIALHLGALCRLLGDLDQAERHLVVALDVAGTLGSPPFEARTEVELAALLDQRGAASTRGRAAALRQAATATARELAAPGLVAALPR